MNTALETESVVVWTITRDNYSAALATIRWDEVNLSALGEGDEGSSTKYASAILEGALLEVGKFHVVNTLAIQLSNTTTDMEDLTRIIEAVAAWSSTDRFAGLLFTNEGVEPFSGPRFTSDPVLPIREWELPSITRSQLVNLRVAIDRLRTCEGWGSGPLEELETLCAALKEEITNLWVSQVTVVRGPVA